MHGSIVSFFEALTRLVNNANMMLEHMIKEEGLNESDIKETAKERDRSTRRRHRS